MKITYQSHNQGREYCLSYSLGRIEVNDGGNNERIELVPAEEQLIRTSLDSIFQDELVIVLGDNGVQGPNFGVLEIAMDAVQLTLKWDLDVVFQESHPWIGLRRLAQTIVEIAEKGLNFEGDIKVGF